MSISCNIKKKLGRFTLKIQFEAQDETVALMGASGCGKSMTLRCIAGIEKPDSGKIIINGITVFDSDQKINLPPQKRQTGLLFQDYALFPNMTVKQNILAVLPKNRQDELEDVITKFHLTGLENHYPSQLSGGQKQRCALARMIVSKPQIIMLDEPFSALDSFLRWQMEQEITSVIKQFGKTVLFVSHDRDEVYRISDKVVVIHMGENERICTKQALYEHPKTYADALLTGCKNIFPVEVTSSQVCAPEYGIILQKEGIQASVSYIGIRARRIRPAHLVTNQSDALLVKYQIESVTEGVFSMILMVRVEHAQGVIRWELTKEEYQQLPDYPQVMAIPYEEIMLLKK